MNSPRYSFRRDMHRRDVPPTTVTLDPDLKALLARLVDTLEVAWVTVDDLARDLASDRQQQGLPTEWTAMSGMIGRPAFYAGFWDPRLLPDIVRKAVIAGLGRASRRQSGDAEDDLDCLDGVSEGTDGLWRS